MGKVKRNAALTPLLGDTREGWKSEYVKLLENTNRVLAAIVRRYGQPHGSICKLSIPICDLDMISPSDEIARRDDPLTMEAIFIYREAGNIIDGELARPKLPAPLISEEGVPYGR